MNIEEVLHILADGISLTAKVRDDIHQAITAHFAPVAQEPAADSAGAQ